MATMIYLDMIMDASFSMEAQVMNVSRSPFYIFGSSGNRFPISPLET